MRINDVMGLIESVRADWNRFLLNPRSQRFGNVISWQRDHVFLFGNQVTFWELCEAAEKRQYSFQIVDGSLVQLYYAFENDGVTLRSARLGYYGMPEAHLAAGFPDEYVRDQFEPDAILANWFRIDFQLGSTSRILHSPTHIHLGGLPMSRIMVQRVPTPKQFVEFLMSTCYPKEYAKHRLKDDGDYRSPGKIKGLHRPCLPSSDLDACGLAINLRVPGSD